MAISDKVPQAAGEPKPAFTLVEVVLAIGVLSIAVISMLGMFAPTLTAVRKVVDSNSAVSSTEEISLFLQDEGFTQVESWLGSASPTKAANTKLYVIPFNNGKPTVVAVTNYPADWPSPAPTPEELDGTVFRIEMKHMPTNYPVGSNPSDYSKSNLEGYIPLMVEMYAVDLSNPDSGGQLTFTFPTAVTR